MNGFFWKNNMLTPYYEHAGITIYHGDCREILPAISEQIELILTDPPYGIGEEYESFTDTPENLKQLVDDTMPLIINAAQRVLLTPGNSNQSLYPKPTWTLAWVVPAGTGANPWGFTCWQPILAYGKDPYLGDCLGRRQDIIIHTESAEKNGHPCPKPLGFWTKLLVRGMGERKGLVVDTFMGSGTTLRAAKSLRLHAVGIDIEEKYCEIAALGLQQDVLDWLPETTVQFNQSALDTGSGDEKSDDMNVSKFPDIVLPKEKLVTTRRSLFNEVIVE